MQRVLISSIAGDGKMLSIADATSKLSLPLVIGAIPHSECIVQALTKWNCYLLLMLPWMALVVSGRAWHVVEHAVLMILPLSSYTTGADLDWDLGEGGMPNLDRVATIHFHKTGTGPLVKLPCMLMQSQEAGQSRFSGTYTPSLQRLFSSKAWWCIWDQDYSKGKS